MLELVTLPETRGEVRRAVMWTRRSRAVGYEVSAYLVDGVLIDTGFPGVAREVGALLDRVRPRGVILTHYHEDHAGNLPEVARRAIPVAASPMTLAAVRVGEHAGLYRRMVWGTMPLFTGALDSFDPGRLELIHTPGHSPDHHVVWDAARETMFGGDLFLGVKVRAVRPGEDPRAHVRSLRAAAALRPRLFLDAHRGPIADPVSALAAKADWMEETVGRIELRISEGWADAAIARDVLGREDAVGHFSRYDLSRRNLVRAVRGRVRGER
jgi:glyoxylase-like metal-dependent hydrolase (beta-lactamase superfamily II)